MKIISVSLLCLFAILTTWSCDGDKITPPQETQKIEFKNLQNKDDVLYNLELAYMERRYDQYDKLLDDNFTFIFSETDYNEGHVDYPQWDRDGEVTSNTKILDPNLNDDKRVISINLKLDYQKDHWTEQPANDDHPGESWYVQTVMYSLTIKTADDWEFRAIDLQAQFTIRWAQTEAGEHWRIVLWRDDVN